MVSAEMTGGGAYNLTTNFVHSGGGFRCLSDITAGPFAGCLAGQGVRWDTAALLASTPFNARVTMPSKRRILELTWLCSSPIFTVKGTET